MLNEDCISRPNNQYSCCAFAEGEHAADFRWEVFLMKACAAVVGVYGSTIVSSHVALIRSRASEEFWSCIAPFVKYDGEPWPAH